MCECVCARARACACDGLGSGSGSQVTNFRQARPPLAAHPSEPNQNLITVLRPPSLALLSLARSLPFPLSWLAIPGGQCHFDVAGSAAYVECRACPMQCFSTLTLCGGAVLSPYAVTQYSHPIQ